MEPDFWLQRWTDNLIGFHQHETNAFLKQYWTALETPAEASVFVPLCGKSLDLVWLAEHAGVLGVELSPRAVEDFFTENRMPFGKSRDGAFSAYTADRLRLLCGDFFDLQPAQLKGVRSVYDRAALIALPAAMRATYVAHLDRLLPAGAGMLLITLAYDQPAMNGPPFAVLEDEVQALFSANWSIEKLDQVDVLAREAKFRDRGLSYLYEQVYLLNKQ